MIVKLIIILYLAVIGTDAINLSDLRSLVYSFLLSKRNLKGAKKIHLTQTKKDRFTLSYIKNHAIYPKEFNFFYKLRIAYISSLIPQYAAIIILNVFSAFGAAGFLLILFIVKLIFALVVIRSQFSGRISRFDKRYSDKR